MTTANILILIGASLVVVWLIVVALLNARDLRKLAGHTKHHAAFLTWLGHDPDLVSKYTTIADYYKHHRSLPPRGPFQTLDNRINEVRKKLPTKQDFSYTISDSDTACHLHWKVVIQPAPHTFHTVGDDGCCPAVLVGEGDTETLAEAQQAIRAAIATYAVRDRYRIVGLSGRIEA